MPEILPVVSNLLESLSNNRHSGIDPVSSTGRAPESRGLSKWPKYRIPVPAPDLDPGFAGMTNTALNPVAGQTLEGVKQAPGHLANGYQSQGGLLTQFLKLLQGYDSHNHYYPDNPTDTINSRQMSKSLAISNPSAPSGFYQSLVSGGTPLISIGEFAIDYPSHISGNIAGLAQRSSSNIASSITKEVILPTQSERAAVTFGNHASENLDFAKLATPVLRGKNSLPVDPLFHGGNAKSDPSSGEVLREPNKVFANDLSGIYEKNQSKDTLFNQVNTIGSVKNEGQGGSHLTSMNSESFSSEDNSLRFSLAANEEWTGFGQRPTGLSEPFRQGDKVFNPPDKSALLTRNLFSELTKWPPGQQTNTFVDHTHENGARALPVKDFEETIIKKMIEKSFVNLRQNHTEIKISLKPGYLGKVYLEFDLSGDKLQGKIFSENHLVKETVEKNLGHLREVLNEKGIVVERLEVFSLEPAGSLPQFGQSQPYSWSDQDQHHSFNLTPHSQRREREKNKESNINKPEIRELSRNLIDLFI